MAAAAGAGASRETTNEKDGLLPVSISSSDSDKQWTTQAAAAAGVEPEPPPPPPRWWEICIGLFFLALLVYLLTGVLHVLFHWQRYFGPFDPVQYTVAIAAVSGLAAANLRQPSPAPVVLDPAFNLTLRVFSPPTADEDRRECVVPGTTVEVSYLLPSSSGTTVPLATGRAPAFCVGVGEVREVSSAVAWGDGVRLPGFVLESLAEDLMVAAGKAEFEVRLVPPFTYCRYCSDTVDVVSCPSAKVGGGPARCSVAKERVSLPPVPRPGGGRDDYYAGAAAKANRAQPTTTAP